MYNRTSTITQQLLHACENARKYVQRCATVRNDVCRRKNKTKRKMQKNHRILRVERNGKSLGTRKAFALARKAIDFSDVRVYII